MFKSKKTVLITMLLTLAISATAAHAAEPLRLRAIMNDMAGEMETIARAVWAEDFEAIEAAAMKVADHEKPSMGERMRILGFLKGRAAGFREADTRVHDDAVALARAAGREDMAGVVEKFGAVMKGCVECHSGHRAEIVEHFYGGGK